MSLLWRLLPSVRRSERSRFLFFMSLSGLISLAQTLGLVGCESLLLAHLGPSALPLVFVGASLLTVLGSLIYAMGVQRARNDVYFIKILLIFAILISWASLAAQFHRHWILPLLYCFYYLSQSVLTNHYWTFTGDFFDTLSAKRLFPLFVMGNSVGGVLGGLAVGFLSDPETLLVLWAASLVGTSVMLRSFRRRLRRWGPLELEEADETSLDGMRNSVRYLQKSSLGRWLVVSCLGMTLALFVAQYLYSDIFSHAFPDADSLSIFLGRLLAATNMLEIVIEVALTPWLIRRMGVATANLLHPVLTLGTFVLLASHYTLWAAIVARMNRETVENALAGPVRGLVYNALPARFRGRMRAFLEGIVVYSGMVTAGVALLVIQGRMSPVMLCAAGSLTGLLYLAANVKVRSEYLRTLVGELRAGRLDLVEMGNEVGAAEVARLGELWEQQIAEESERPSRSTLRTVGTLAERGVHEPLVKGCKHAHPALRKACLEALSAHQKPGHLTLFIDALEDPVTDIRLVAIRALPRHKPRASVSGQAMRALVALQGRQEDPDPRVRAEAAARLGSDAYNLLTRMAMGGPVEAVSALEVLPVDLLPLALERAEDDDLTVRAAALGCLARHQACCGEEPDAEEPTTLRLARENVKNHSPLVRTAALRLLACQDGAALHLLASSLGDNSHEVRQTASKLLAERGDAALALAEPYLQSESPRTVTAAVSTLAHLGTQKARERLGQELRARVRQAWSYLLWLHVLWPNGFERIESSSKRVRLDEPAAPVDRTKEFLGLTLHNAALRNQRLAFEILERLEDAKVFRSVAKVLRFANSRGRADALEVLSNLGDREASHLLVLMLDEGHVEDKIPSLPPAVPRPGSVEQILQMALESQDRWIALGAAGASGKAGESQRRDDLMERLLMLRRVPLFAQMTLEQLEAINQLLQEEQYLEDEQVFREGDVGDELYILIDGEVRIMKGQGTPQELELKRVTPVNYFGEMAILDDEPRSAGVQVTRDSRLLVLKGEQLKDLVLQMPEIAFEIFKVLTSRIRQADDRLRNLQPKAN